MPEKEEMIYTGGAQRSGKILPYHDIPPIVNDLIAQAFSEGREKYESGKGSTSDLCPWDKNWERGNVNFALDVLNHAQHHLDGVKSCVTQHLRASQGLGLRVGTDIPHPAYKGEDLWTHLSHLGANYAMLAHFTERGYWDTAPDATTNSGKPYPGPPEAFPEPVDETEERAYLSVPADYEEAAAAPEEFSAGTLEKIKHFFGIVAKEGN